MKILPIGHLVKTNPTCRGVAPAASPPRRGEAGSKPIYVELTKTSKGANSMFFNIIKEQSEEKSLLWNNWNLPVWDGMAAANGQLYLAMKNGRVLCLAKK